MQKESYRLLVCLVTPAQIIARVSNSPSLSPWIDVLRAVEPDAGSETSADKPTNDAWLCALRLQDGANVSLRLRESASRVEPLHGDFTLETWFRLKVGAKVAETDDTIAHLCEVLFLVTSTTA